MSSHTQYLLPLGSETEIETMRMEQEAKSDNDVTMRDTSLKRKYTRYSDQDKVRFFKLFFFIGV
jgi:hypothetical protein